MARGNSVAMIWILFVGFTILVGMQTQCEEDKSETTSSNVTSVPAQGSEESIPETNQHNTEPVENRQPGESGASEVAPMAPPRVEAIQRAGTYRTVANRPALRISLKSTGLIAHS